MKSIATEGSVIIPSVSSLIQLPPNSKIPYVSLDYIYAEVIGLEYEYFSESNGFKFTPKMEGWEIVLSEWLIVKGMKLEKFPSGRVYLSGSLHKYFNHGLHNHNDFDFESFLSVLTRLKVDFGIMPCNLKIISLEYGVNINPPIDTTSILDCLLNHKRVDFEKPISGSRGHFLKAEHDRFVLKVYDKAKQYRLNEQLLRIEIKTKGWVSYRKKGIDTLEDFIHWDKTELVNDLLRRWDEVIFFDPTNREANKWTINYSNPNYWRELFVNASDKTVSKHRYRLKKMNEVNGDNIQGQISSLILGKVIELQGAYAELPTFRV